MSRAPRSPRIDLAGFPPAAPSGAGWQRHATRRNRGPRDADAVPGGEAEVPPAPDLTPPTAATVGGPRESSRAAPPGAAAAASAGATILDGEALPTADVVAERAQPLRPTPGSAPSSEPVRLVVPTVASPFAPGREVAFARVQGDLLARLGVRDGDHVALWRRDTAEPGDLAAVLDATGRAGLWRVYPERDELRLTTGDPADARRSGRRPRVQGVVVAVHRSFATRPAVSKAVPPRAASRASAARGAAVERAARGRTSLTSAPSRAAGRA